MADCFKSLGMGEISWTSTEFQLPQMVIISLEATQDHLVLNAYSINNKEFRAINCFSIAGKNEKFAQTLGTVMFGEFNYHPY